MIIIMKDGFLMKILFVLLLSFLLIAGLAACGGGDESEPEVLAAPGDEAIVEAVPPAPVEAEINGAGAGGVEAHGLEEDLPEIDELFEMATFVGEFDWSMETVGGWTQVDIAGLNIFASPYGSGSHLNVHVDRSQGKSLDEFVDFTLGIMESAFPDFHLHVNDRVVINGKDAILLVFETSAIPGVYRSYQFFIVADETVFAIAYSRMPGTDYFDDVMAMLDTFTIFSRQ